MSGLYDIYIYEKDGEYRVRPPTAMIDNTQKSQLGIRNLTAYVATIFFPPNLLMDGPIVTVNGNEADRFNLHPEANGIYSYSVLISKHREVVAAVGESGPSVIIDR